MATERKKRKILLQTRRDVREQLAAPGPYGWFEEPPTARPRIRKVGDRWVAEFRDVRVNIDLGEPRYADDVARDKWNPRVDRAVFSLDGKGAWFYFTHDGAKRVTEVKFWTQSEIRPGMALYEDAADFTEE